LWNIDLTLVDVARVSRDAYAEAFRQVTGRPLVALPQMAGRTDSEIFFESLALNPPAQHPAAGEARQPDDAGLLSGYTAALASAFDVRAHLLPRQGRILPGAKEAIAAVARLPNVVQTVLTGSIRPDALHKLRAFDLDRHLDIEVGGYGSDAYPKGTLIVRSLDKATQKYGARMAPAGSVYLADSVRDVAAARVGGVRSIGVASGRSTLSELRDAGADQVLTDLADTARVVAAITA
jgi:phosphoglycolate phosphatase